MIEQTTSLSTGPYMNAVFPMIRRSPARLGGGPLDDKDEESRKKYRALLKRVGLSEMSSPGSNLGRAYDLGKEKLPKDLNKDGPVADDSRATDKKPDYAKDAEKGKLDEPLKKDPEDEPPPEDEPEEKTEMTDTIHRFRSISTSRVSQECQQIERLAYELTLEEFEAEDGPIFEHLNALFEEDLPVYEESLGLKFVEHVLDEMSRRNLRRTARNIDKGRTKADAGTQAAASKFRRREAGAYKAKKKMGRFARAVGRGIKKAAGAVARGAKKAAPKVGRAARATGSALATGAKAAGRGAKAAAQSRAAGAVGRGAANVAGGLARGVGDAAKAVGREVMTRTRERGQYNQAKRMKKLQTADVHEALAAFRENQALTEAKRQATRERQLRRRPNPKGRPAGVGGSRFQRRMADSPDDPDGAYWRLTSSPEFKKLPRQLRLRILAKKDAESALEGRVWSAMRKAGAFKSNEHRFTTDDGEAYFEFAPGVEGEIAVTAGGPLGYTVNVSVWIYNRENSYKSTSRSNPYKFRREARIKYDPKNPEAVGPKVKAALRDMVKAAKKA